MAITISVPDALRQSVEAASGGRNTVLYDSKGYPSIMVVVPRFTIEDIDPALGSGTHPAFLVGGVQKSEIFYAKFQAITHDDHALSLPGQGPRASINFDAAAASCSAKGPGWHLATNAEWSAVALWSWKNGFLPRGNTDWGRDHAQTYETARRADGEAPGDSSEGNGRTLTGSGPASWFHDNTPSGIADMTGNVHEWVAGLRLVDGEIQVIPDNNAAAAGADLGAGSDLWRAVLENGSLVAPGTADTLKWDADGVGGAGNPVLSTAVTSQTDGDTGASQMYKDLTAEQGVSVPDLLKIMGLYPHATDMERGRLWLRNEGERLPIRGGDRNSAGRAGVFALLLYTERSYSSATIGFRPAFVL